jgi:cell division protein FtsN
VFWFLFGGVVGAFGVGYAWMTHEPSASGQVDEAATTRPPAKPPHERTFDFYSLLPEEEVVVPSEDVTEQPPALPPAQQPASGASTAPASRPTPTPAPRPAPATTSMASAKPDTTSASGSDTYLLQVGSFRNDADAERLKAQLALLGIQTGIQTVTIDSGQTYHRVRTGTYAKSDAQSVRARLEQAGHETIMIRAR